MAVSPFVVPLSHPIATTSGSINIVNVTSRNVVSSSYTGPGNKRSIKKKQATSNPHKPSKSTDHVLWLHTCLTTSTGAGRYPTANSVVSDIVRISRGFCGPAFPLESNVWKGADTMLERHAYKSRVLILLL